MMMIDIPSVSDNGAAIDHSERKLANARRVRDDAMRQIEASRRGRCELSRDDYSAQKLRHGNAEAAVRYWKHLLRSYRGFHFDELSNAWMYEQCDIKISKRPSLALLWRHWRDVLAARKAFDKLLVIVPPDKKQYFEDDYGGDKDDVYVGSVRQRVEAQATEDRAVGLYDIVSRAYDGRAPRTGYRPPHKVRRPPLPEPATRINQNRRAAVQRASMNWE